MVPELGKLRLYTTFLYHSSSEILHLHQSSTLGVAFCKTVKQSLRPYLLHTPSTRPLKMRDETTAETCPLTQGDSLQIRIELI